MKINPRFVAFVQALGLTVYVALVAFFMKNAEKWFGSQKGNEMFGITVFLLVFVISAVVSASIMLAYPATLFFRGKRKTALKIVLQSVGWLAVFIALIIIFAFQK